MKSESLAELKKRMLDNDPEFRKEYYRFDLWFELGQLWLELRCIVRSLLKKGTHAK